MFVLTVLHRCVAPLLMGVCMAATAEMTDIASMVAFLSTAVACGFFSFPAGGRMIMRLAETKR